MFAPNPYSLTDGKLLGVNFTNIMIVGDIDKWKEVVPKIEQKFILNKYHNDILTGAHLRVYNTCNLLLPKYYWAHGRSHIKARESWRFGTFHTPFLFSSIFFPIMFVFSSFPHLIFIWICISLMTIVDQIIYLLMPIIWSA